VGVLLSRRGYRVHLIDANPQASMSQAFGVSDPEDRFACSLIDGGELSVDMLDDKRSPRTRAQHLDRTAQGSDAGSGARRLVDEFAGLENRLRRINVRDGRAGNGS